MTYSAPTMAVMATPGGMNHHHIPSWRALQATELYIIRPSETPEVGPRPMKSSEAADDVRALVPEVVPDSTWAFLDAVADRRAGDAGRLLDHLLESAPEPLVIVQLHRRLRELTMAADLVESRATPAAMVKAIGGHPFKVQKLAEQARRWTPAELEAVLEGVLELDAMVKGAPDSFRTGQQARLAFVLWVQERVATGAAVRARGR